MTSSADLQIDDTQAAKQGLVLELADRPDLLPPVYIISHRRASNLQTLLKIPQLCELATVVVSDEELTEYTRALPGVQLIPIPENYRGLSGGVGRARQFCLDTAELLGQEEILILDDDTLKLTLLYEADGKACRSTANTDLPVLDYHFGVLVLAALAAQDAFRAHPGAVLASTQCNASNRTLYASRHRWQLNRGGPPAQLQVWAVEQYVEDYGCLPLSEYNWHGDDIGVAVQILAGGGSVVKVPSVVGNYSDYETASVIRNVDTAPALRAAEHAALMAGPLAEYVKTRYDMLDRPQWHSLDWPKLERDGLAVQGAALWSDPLA